MSNFDKLRHFENFDTIYECLKISSSKILEIYKDLDPTITYKEDNSPLTQADLAANQHITSSLNAIGDLPIISEENNVRETQHSKYWLVDPLDGTKEFIKKNGEFTINIALIENQYPSQGYVYSPISGFLYVGGAGLGSFKIKNNEINTIKVRKAVEPIKIVASRSHLNEDTQKFIQQYQNHELLQAGSSIKLCMIAEGLADIYPRLAPTSEWDTAAAQAVVEGAGGSVKDLQGNRLRYQKDNILNPHFIVRGNI